MPRGNDIRIRSGTTTPSAADFNVGEPAWDKSAGKLYVKNAAGSMVEIGSGGGGSSIVMEDTPAAFPATGNSAYLYVARDSGQLFRWETSAYVELGPSGSLDPRWSYLLPAAPTGVTATAANAQATVSWPAPASAAPITDYYVQYSSNSGSTWQTFSEGTSAETSATVSGLQNGTTYIFRVAAISGIGQGAYSITSVDPNWSNVALLAHFDGGFTDSGPAGLSASVGGSAAVSTQAKKFGSGSAYFPSGNNSTTNVVNYGSGSAWNIMQNDFTIECWAYATAVNNYAGIIARDNQSDRRNWALLVSFDGVKPLSFVTYNTSGSAFLALEDTAAFPVNQWVHVAVVRDGGTFRLYRNGVQVASAAAAGGTGTLATASGPLGIGALNENGNYGWQGYIDEVRVTRACLYPSGATFTPSATAFADYATATPGGDSYFSSVYALLHMDGSGATFTDSSGSPKTITVYGNATQTTAQSKFGGKSGYFDGSGDYLALSSVDLSSTNCVIEGFFRVADSSAFQTLVALFNINGAPGLHIHTFTGAQLHFNNGVAAAIYGGTVPSNQWFHVAAVSSSGTLRLYLDGSLIGTASQSLGSGTVQIGWPGGAGSSYLNGYADEIRITIGSDRGYTGSTIPVPTAPYPNS
jgi:hypothetical protein